MRRQWSTARSLRDGEHSHWRGSRLFVDMMQLDYSTLNVTEALIAEPAAVGRKPSVRPSITKAAGALTAILDKMRVDACLNRKPNAELGHYGDCLIKRMAGTRAHTLADALLKFDCYLAASPGVFRETDRLLGSFIADLHCLIEDQPSTASRRSRIALVALAALPQLSWRCSARFDGFCQRSCQTE